jgi:hemolysin activation/secretion protein
MSGFLFRLHLFLGLLCAAAAAGRAQSEAPAPSRPGTPLRQIVIVEGLEAAEKAAFVPGAGFLVWPASLAHIDTKELRAALQPGENRLLDDRLLVGIAQIVEGFLRRNDYPIARAIIPPQNIAEGALRVAIQLGKFREVRFQGNRWFSDTLLREKLHVDSGKVVRLSELERGINWTNNNPFRRVRVHVDPIPNTDEANLIVGVQDQLPLRLQTSVDNGGNEIIGKHRFTAGVTYGNVWGRDHEASYQFITTDEYPVYRGHGASYRMPLPRQHHLSFSGSYSRARPEFFDGLFVQDGETITGDLRYSAPLRVRDNPLELFAGLNYKQSNNNLEFGGTEVQTNKTDSFQLSAGVSTVIRDKRGGWILGATVTTSPGDVNSRNTDAVFGEVRFGAKASYTYAHLSLQRVTLLAQGWEMQTRAQLQRAGGNLLVNEQFNVGGATSVRGYDENSGIGDEGFQFSHDLLTPALRRPVPFLAKSKPPLETRALLFFDAARVNRRFVIRTDRATAPLASVGVGLRSSLPGHFSLNADFGWHAAPSDTRTYRSRGHLKLVLAY